MHISNTVFSTLKDIETIGIEFLSIKLIIQNVIFEAINFFK
jgi:hypothetical protein